MAFGRLNIFSSLRKFILCSAIFVRPNSGLDVYIFSENIPFYRLSVCDLTGVFYTQYRFRSQYQNTVFLKGPVYIFTQLTAKSYCHCHVLPILCSLFKMYIKVKKSIYNTYTNIHIQHKQCLYIPMTAGEQRVNCNVRTS